MSQKNFYAKRSAEFIGALIIMIISLILTVACNSGVGGEETSAAETSAEVTTALETDEETTSEVTTDIETTPEATTVEETTVEETTEEETQVIMTKLNYEDMKCMWISQFDLNPVYCNNGTQRSESDFRAKMEVILDNVSDNGFNTVILQMRPNADSMYPSDLFAPSAYVVGSYGKDFEYDPVEIIVDMAHERKISIHAWINPLRGVTDAQIKQISDVYLLRQWYDDDDYKGKYIVQNGSTWYLNPAYEEVRQLIIDGAAEIFEKYDVDGLHMDDYFYPTTDAAFDSAAYNEYKNQGGKLSLLDFRREALSQLVSGLYQVTKAADPQALYGVSPAGNWNTVYDAHCADVYLWCSEKGYLDYICPQVYFGMEHGSYDFVKTSEKWQSMISDESGVKLIIGMSLGKAISGVDNFAGKGKNEWSEHKDILKRCLEYTAQLDRCTGVSYFCYQYFYDPTSGAENAASKEERGNFIPILKEISWNN